jgi:hypothetical protein
MMYAKSVIHVGLPRLARQKVCDLFKTFAQSAVGGKQLGVCEEMCVGVGLIPLPSCDA